MSALLIAPATRPRPVRSDGARARGRVLEAILALQAEGLATTTAAIAKRARISSTTAQDWRARLIAEGAVVCVRARTGPAPGTYVAARRGLVGDSPAEREEIAVRIAEASARRRALDRGGRAAALSVRVGRTGRVARNRQARPFRDLDGDPRGEAN